jgi:tetratricopeptide (TPR) repeat protein
MKKITIYLFFIFYLLISLFPANYSEFIKRGDEFFKERGDLKKAILALKNYKKASTLKKDAYEALWKIARTTHYLVDELKSEEEQRKIIDMGIEAARKAIIISPDKPDGYFWLGVNYAKEGQVKGVLKSLFRISPIKKNMRKVIEMDDKYEGGGAYIVLGRVYSQVPGILGGSNRKAEANLLKAMRICNTNPLTYIFLAEVYHDMGKIKKAIRTLTDFEKIEVDPRWNPETRKKKKEGLDFLKIYSREIKK